MADRLAASLANLRLTSPSPVVSGAGGPTTCFLLIDDMVLLDASLNSHLYAHMNPRDLASLGCNATSLLFVDRLAVKAWPNAKVPPKTVAISMRAASWLKLESEALVKVEAFSGPSIRLSSLKVTCLQEITPRGAETLDLLKAELLSLSHFQENLLYSWSTGDSKQGISFIISSADFGRQEDREDKVVPVGIVIPETRIAIEFCPLEQEKKETLPIAPSSSPWIGGLETEYTKIKDALEMSISNYQLLKEYHVRPPRGILLFGPPGTGKSLLARHVASKMALKLFVLDGGKLGSKYYGETEASLRNVFDQARRNGETCIIFIDEIDSICPRRDSPTAAGTDLRLVASLLTELDGLTDSNEAAIFVIAATNCPDNIDPALRRPGRLDFEIEIGIPKADQRLEILKGLLAPCDACISQSTLNRIAQAAHGFVGADLQLLVKEAWLSALGRNTTNSKKTISDRDLEAAFVRTKPSAIREMILEVPKIKWDDIGGMEDTKQQLRESIEWPMLVSSRSYNRPEKFKAFGIKPPKGILLYGPPGCSKTLLAKALATESGLNFMAIKGPEVFSKWVGDSERAIRDIFRKARLASPSIIFFDEFDAIAARRSSSQTNGSSATERVLSQLLSEMDGSSPLTDVTVVAATNRPDIIDPALLRPGRFDRQIYVPLPDSSTRLDIITKMKAKMPFADDVCLDALSHMTEGYSGAEVVAIGQEAALQAMCESIDCVLIHLAHFQRACKVVTPRTPPEMIEFFETYRKKR